MDNTTSYDKKQAMRRRVPPSNNRVVRQLFPDNDVTRQSNNDNLANLIQEAIATEHEVMKQRWNFDFRNELPLNGPYEWTKSDGVNDWIGIKSSNTEVATKLDPDIEEFDSQTKLSVKIEKTPKGEKKENIPIIRKRKTNQYHVVDMAARRKISFDSN